MNVVVNQQVSLSLGDMVFEAEDFFHFLLCSLCRMITTTSRTPTITIHWKRMKDHPQISMRVTLM